MSYTHSAYLPDGRKYAEHYETTLGDYKVRCAKHLYRNATQRITVESSEKQYSINVGYEDEAIAWVELTRWYGNEGVAALIGPRDGQQSIAIHDGYQAAYADLFSMLGIRVGEACGVSSNGFTYYRLL